jgi:L-rhamnose mutarotase
MLKAPEESIGYKSRKNKKPLRTWNDLKDLTKRKKQAYRIYLQSKNTFDCIKYKKLRAEVRKLSRKIRREDWNKYVMSL